MKEINKKTTYLLLVLLFSYGFSFAQNNKLWSEETPTSLLLFQKNSKKTSHKKERICRLNLSMLKQKLSGARQKTRSKKQELIIPFPDKDGTLTDYIVTETPTFSPELQNKYPNIRSYTGISNDSLKTVVRFSVSDFGLNLMKYSKNGNSEFIDPYTKDALTYAIYSKNDFLDDLPNKICNILEKEQNKASQKSTQVSKIVVNDGKLRTYRLALSCTGEYAEFHIADQGLESETDAVKRAAILSAMNTSMTRINGVFERDVALTMQLVANNESLIFLDPDTDGYTSNDDFEMLDEVQEKCDNIIGTANYDIGHLFTTGESGLAELGSPCTNIKAKGVSGRNPAKGDSFDIDFVAHEMGHQFGATHTFNNSCSGNISNSTSIEPGSGTTIMGYAGICAPNIQAHSDDYFHGISIEQMYNNIVFGNSTCAEQTDIGNTPPTANAGSNFTIPISTPFSLTGIGTDDNGTLTYCWEQTDTQIAAMPPLPTSSVGPLFRSLPPTNSNERHFPNIQTTLSGNTGNTWEQLPSVSRELKFKLTIRDNETPTGQFATDDTKITVSNTAGPFKITSQNTSESYYAGESKTITWDVANTNLEPINTDYVDILLSKDGGITFPIVLDQNVPNNGSRSVIIPSEPTTNGRVKVIPVNNVYYSINEEDFTILAANFTMTLDDTSISTCAPDDAVYNFQYNTYQGFNEETTFSVTNLPTGATAVFSPEKATADNTMVTLTISSISESQNGLHQPILTGTSLSDENNVNLSLMIDTEIETKPFLSYPQNNTQNLSTNIKFTWTAENETSSYIIDIATDLEFSNIVETSTTEFEHYTATNLNQDSTYYWRVKETNSCDTGENSLIYKFQTGQIEEFIFNNNEETDIPDNDTNGINSTIIINENIEISDINITLNINHPYIGDIKAILKNPEDQEIILVLNSDNNGNNYTNTIFDDGATATIPQGSAPYSGTFKPHEELSVYNTTLSNGNWTLNISDNEADDQGSLLNWKITLNGIDQGSLSNKPIPNDSSPEITKAFSPNGDQINDYWTIQNINTTGFENNKYPFANVKIFNTLGQLIYASDKYKNNWDGTNKSGSKLPVGAYIYEVSFSDPQFKVQKGWIYIKY